MKVLWFLGILLICFSACNDDSPRNPKPKPLAQTKEKQPRDVNASKNNRLDQNIRSIFQDQQGNYWFGTNNAGVYRYDGKHLRQFTVKDGLSNNQVLHIQQDNKGNLWFSTGLFGISKYDGNKFSSYTQKISPISFSAIDWKSRSSELWFYAGGGVFRLTSSSFDYLPFLSSSTSSPFSLSRFAVYCIHQDRRGNVWFGTQAEGVCKFDGQNLTWFKEKGLAGPAVLALFEDRKGILWFGNNGGGLYRYDGQNLVHLTKEKGLENVDFIANGKPRLGTLARVYAINEDNNGHLWIGTVDAGVWKYDGNIFTNFTTKDGLSSNAVNTIYKDQKGELWFGTDNNGICKFNGRTFTRFTIP